MSKVTCLTSFAALCSLSILDKTPDLSGASLRLVLAITFSTALISLVRQEFSDLLG